MNTTLKPKVLQWARLRAGLSEADLSGKVKVPEAAIASWEQTGSIEVELVPKVAEATKIPFGYFFLDAPPSEDLPISDFRRVGGRAPVGVPSRALLTVIYQCQRRQAWYRDYLIANGSDPLRFVGALTIETPIKEAAEQIATTLKIGANFNKSYKDWEEAMRRSVENIEDAGIIVNRVGYAESNTRNTLSVDEFRGFALSDNYAPLIFVNGADAPSAQMFTMAHEAVHIWIGESGVSNLPGTFAEGTNVEEFSNQVAAEILVPMQQLATDWNNAALATDEAKRLARAYRVSPLVMARRALDAGRMSNAVYWDFYKSQIAEGKRSGGGGTYYSSKPYEASRRLSIAIIQDAKNGRTMLREAMNLLNIKTTATFERYAEALHLAK